MTYSFPRIVLSDTEMLWIQEAYSIFKNNERPDTRILKAKLLDKLPPKFDPHKIDCRLIAHGFMLTPLGVWHADPQTDLLEKIDRTIQTIRGLLIENPNLEEVSAAQITQLTGIQKSEVAIIFAQMNQLIPFGKRQLGTELNPDITLLESDRRCF
jgi:hypothetical protein